MISGEEPNQALTLRDAICKRPQMYISRTDERGVLAIFEIALWDAYQEAREGRCTEIAITLERDATISIIDNGPPFSNAPDPDGEGYWLERVLTETQ